jgi:hypothetical protein
MNKITIPEMPRRRLMLAGAGAAGALAAADAVRPVVPGAASQALEDQKDAPDRGGGYQVTQHVLRYYEKARV